MDFLNSFVPSRNLTFFDLLTFVFYISLRGMSRENEKEIQASRYDTGIPPGNIKIAARTSSGCGQRFFAYTYFLSLRQYCVQSLSVQEAQVRAALAPSQKRSGWTRMAISHASQARMATTSRLTQ